MIYVYLRGRIGNQLFIYAFARRMSEELGDKEIIIDDTYVIKSNYENSLQYYNLPNVKYVHSHIRWLNPKLIRATSIYALYRILRRKYSYNERYNIEKKWQKFFNKNGLVLCENGYLEFDVKRKKNIFIDGYYQSEKYFNDIKDEIRETYSLLDNYDVNNYPGINLINNMESVCISIKVQHNVGNSMYDVCNNGYWQKAINYICYNVKNPLFFICSDNVEFVKKNLIDCNKYNVIFQDSSYPVHISLAVMAKCKHFIIGNTTFGWWAQYLSTNREKIVIAPSKWMKIDMPIVIYQDNWHLIEV